MENTKKLNYVINRIEKEQQPGKRKKYIKELKKPLSAGKEEEKIRSYLLCIAHNVDQYGISSSTTAAEILYRHAKTAAEQIDLIQQEKKYARIKSPQHIDAQRFIIRAAQKKEKNLSSDVTQCAFNAFYDFFHNFVRSECTKSFLKNCKFQKGTQGFSDAIDEAVNSCFLAIIENFQKYDTGKNIAPTSYFSGYIKGAIDEYRSLSLGHASKTTFQIDRKIKRVMNELQTEKNECPNVSKIAELTGYTIDQVQLSLGRLNIINNATSLESSEYLERHASEMDNPEQAYIQKENASEMCEAISQLSDMEKNTISLLMGIHNINGELVNAPACTISEVSELLGISEKEVNRYHASATKKLKVILSSREKMEEVDARILDRHEVMFNNTSEDEEVKNVIDTIIEIED